MLANKPTGSLLEPLRPLATNLCPSNSLCYPTRLPGPLRLVSHTSTLHEPTSLLLSATTTYLPASDPTSPPAFYPPWPPPPPCSLPSGPQDLADRPRQPPPTVRGRPRGLAPTPPAPRTSIAPEASLPPNQPPGPCPPPPTVRGCPLSLAPTPQAPRPSPAPRGLAPSPPAPRPLPAPWPRSLPTGPQNLDRPQGLAPSQQAPRPLPSPANCPWLPPRLRSLPTGPQALARPLGLAPSPPAPRTSTAPLGRPQGLAPSQPAPRPSPAPADRACPPPPPCSLPSNFQGLPDPPWPSSIAAHSSQRTHVDSESIRDGRHIRTRYNLRPLKLSSCSPGILVAASKAGHQGTSMIGTAHTWHTFQKIPDWLQISGRVEGGGGLRVEEEADLNREAPSSPLTEYSYSGEPSKPAPSKPAHSKKHTKKLPQPPPPPPPPKCLRHSQPNPQIPTLISKASRQACVVCDVYWGCSLNHNPEAISIPQNDDGPSNTNQPEDSAQTPVKQLTRKQEKAKLYSAQLWQKNRQASNIKYSGKTRIRAHVSNSNPNARI
ncbi:hypothetical protein PCASD_15929 [Puccinia coronata f. sp. avenae]|uniref:Uncharacterized protein n=1 Tax=Puccinia coronata f. sp. avenae TaxID=200324 RepID=A0A2N5UEX7_9BASI|nr:hypothetical protein PCASD_15929 [Puccinia coronata f. sp. avenae]